MSQPPPAALDTRRPRGAPGFTLVELLIALVLLLLALALAAQVLAESAQAFAAAEGEAAEPPAPLLLARLRGDVRAAGACSILADGGLRLDSHPAGTVVYRKLGAELRREVYDAAGAVTADAPAWRNVVAFESAALGSRLAVVAVRYRRKALGRSPLPGLPADRGPAWEERTATLVAAARGAGLGASW